MKMLNPTVIAAAFVALPFQVATAQTVAELPSASVAEVILPQLAEASLILDQPEPETSIAQVSGHQKTIFPRPKLLSGERVNQGKVFTAGNTDTMSQLNSVQQLSDVQPTDWAYEALRSLGERYGCLVGYPDQTFRGNRALTRWEFAAGLNACLNTSEQLLQENVANYS